MKKISYIISTLVLFLGLFSLAQNSWADSCGLLFDYHYYGGSDAYYIAAASKVGMQFSRTANFTVTKVKVAIGQITPGPLNAFIYPDDGNSHIGASPIPGGAFTPINDATGGMYELSLPTPLSLSANTKYWLVFNGGSSSVFSIKITSASGYVSQADYANRYDPAFALNATLFGCGSDITANCERVGKTCYPESQVNPSCDREDVEACMYNYVQDGDVLQLGSGTCNWAGEVWFYGGIGVTLRGTGQTTTILNQTGSSSFFNAWVGMSGGNYRVTNLGLTGTAGDSGGSDFVIDGNWNSMRIDHVTFNTTSRRAFYIGAQGTLADTISGITQKRKVLMHDLTWNAASGRQFLLLNGVSRSWWEDDGLGSDNYVIMEGSTFTFPDANGTVTDIDFGGRITFRYNTVTNGNGILCHDLGSQRGRGTRLKEIYNNHFICNLTSCGTALNVDRGGSSLVYNNVFTGTWGLLNWPELARQAIDGTQYGGGFCSTSGSKKVCEDVQHHCIGGTKAGYPCYYEWDCPSGTCDATRPMICLGGANNGQSCTSSSQCGGICGSDGYCVGQPNSTCTQASDCGHSCGYDIACSSNADCKRPDGSPGVCMQLDGSGSNGYAGWPCRDQMGRGKDDPVTGVQSSLPTRWWNNKLNGTNFDLLYPWKNYETNGVDYCSTTGTSMPNPCNGITLSYLARICPDPRTGYNGSCDSSIAGTAGYKIGSTDTTPPAAPTGLAVN